MGDPGESTGRSRVTRWIVIALLAALLLLAGMIGGALFLRGNWPLNDTQPPQAAALPADTALVVGAGEIDVEGGILPLSPVPTGLVQQVHIHDGQHVQANDKLLELDATEAREQLEAEKLKVQSATATVAQANDTANKQAEAIRLQEVAVEIAKLQVEGANQKVQRLEELVGKGLQASHESELKAARNQLAILEKSLESEQLKLVNMKSLDPMIAVRQAEALKAQAEHALVVAEKKLQYYTLRAPVAGVVLRVLARQGQLWTTPSREPAVWFKPDRPWVVRCEIDQQFVNRVRPNMPCDIYDDRAEGLSWKGKVKSVSGWVGPRRLVTEDLTAWRDVRMIECFVELDGSPDNVRIGQRVRVVMRTGERP